MSPKVRFQLVLEPSQLKGLRALKDQDGASVGESVRRAIDTYLAAKRKRKSARENAGGAR